MSKYKIVISGLLLSLSCVAAAETCRETNQNLPFRQVVLGLYGGGARCDYGKEFDFDHSYDVAGDLAPVSGPWSGASDPYTVFCRGSAASCVFKVKPQGT